MGWLHRCGHAKFYRSTQDPEERLLAVGLGRVPRGQDEAVTEQELEGGSAGGCSPGR